MSATVLHRGSLRALRGPALLTAILAMAAMLLTLHGLVAQLPAPLWWQAGWHPDLTDPRELVVAYSAIPRVFVAWLCGASLALAGAVFQQVMRNPLAEPGTLGTSAGAFLALTVAAIAVPDLAGFGREAVALAGSTLATALVFGLAARRGLAPVPLVIAGLIVSLTCGSIAATLMLFVNPYDLSLYLWGAGSLSQNDWSVVLSLAPHLGLCGLVVVALARPLTVLRLEDEGARSLGLSLFGVRLAALATAVALSAGVVDTVGVIGFVGLAAPALARMSGARRLGQQIVWSPLIGAGLLWLTDQLVLLMSRSGREWIPTGAATAIIGAPFLLWLLARTRLRPDLPKSGVVAGGGGRPRLRGLPEAVVLLFLLAVMISLTLGQGLQGWHWSGVAEAVELLPWRGPRLLAAAAAGAMLAAAGTLAQRMTGNPMASPEVLGIGGGAALGLIALMVLAPHGSAPMQLAAMTAGALATFGLIVTLARRSGFAPERVLLAGIAIAAFFNVAVTAIMATRAPGISMLKVWMAGSTDFVTPRQALSVCAMAVVLIGLTPLTGRWLAVLPLGGEMAQAVGLGLKRSRFLVLLLVAGLTACATLIVGPLGFIGLMAPHMAQMAGVRRPVPQVFAAAAIGALVMVVADWLGRTLLFPYQIPAGLLASIVGGPYFLILMRRRST